MKKLFYVMMVSVFLLQTFVSQPLYGLVDPAKEKRIVVSQVGSDRYKLRIYLNADNPYEISAMYVEPTSQLAVTLPIPNRFNVLDMKAHVEYTSSINVENDGSTIALKLNKHYVTQSELLEKGRGGGTTIVDYSIPTDKLFEGYNTVCIAIQQRGTKGSGGSDKAGAPSIDNCANFGQVTTGITTPVWTQIDTRNSYIEMTFKLKSFEEKLSSIQKYLFDSKNHVTDKINFVFPATPTEQDLQNYGFMANVIGNILKFKDIDFTVSTELVSNRNNVIVMTKDKVTELLKKYDDNNGSVSSKINGNINVVTNPKNNLKGILVITGDSQSIIESAILRVADSDLLLMEEHSIAVGEKKTPEKSLPFSTDKFVPFDVDVPFSKMKYTTRTFSGDSTNSVTLDFLLYPIYRFDENYSISIGVNTLSADNTKLMGNLFLNGNFAHQFVDTKPFYSSNASDFKTIVGKNISSALINGGKNNLRLNMSVCSRDTAVPCNSSVMNTTIKDDSYIHIPRGKMEVEYPNLKYISDMGFPFSIYPDLQNTGILITDFYAETIASAMHIAFQLGKTVENPGYRMILTYDINKVLDRDIIVIGGQIDKYAPLYENAPIKFIKTANSKKEISLERQMKLKSVEKIDFSSYLIAQTYQSPFNPRRVVFELLAKTPKTLLKGVQEGLITKNLGNFDGDLWLYNLDTEKTSSYSIAEKYKVRDIIEDENVLYDDEQYKKITEF